MARRVAITGATGQLGRALIERFSERWCIDPLDRATVDICSWHAVRDRIAWFQPDLVIHAAAATDVDGCEVRPAEAFAVNALGTRFVAQAAALVDAELIYISTNYVFDGEKTSPYHEFDHPRPISVYGASKLAGEQEARAATQRCHILRTAWLYSGTGRNFVQTMRRLMRERERLTVVADQFGNPTYVADLADAIGQIADRPVYGVHHVVNAGSASWHTWAAEIAALIHARTTLEPIPGSEWTRAATPPANGVLESLSLPALGIEMPDWRDALRRCLAT